MIWHLLHSKQLHTYNFKVIRKVRLMCKQYFVDVPRRTVCISALPQAMEQSVSVLQLSSLCQELDIIQKQ